MKSIIGKHKNLTRNLLFSLLAVATFVTLLVMPIKISAIGITDGDLIRLSTLDSGVYLVDQVDEELIKKPIPSELVFNSWNYNWSNVEVITPTEFEDMDDGSAVIYNVDYRNGDLINLSGGGVYLVDGGQKQAIPS